MVQKPLLLLTFPSDMLSGKMSPTFEEIDCPFARMKGSLRSCALQVGQAVP